MKSLGGFLVLMGVGSFVLNAMGRELTLLMWIDTWGAGVGTAIRVGLIALGIALFVIGKKKEA